MPIDRAGRTNDPLSPATTLSHVPFVLVASGSRIVHRELNGRPMRPGSEKVLALSSIKGPVRCENRSFRSSDSRRKALYVNRGVFHRTYRPSPHPTRPRNDLQCGFVSGPDFSQAASCPSSPHPRSLDGSERTSPVCLSSLERRLARLIRLVSKPTLRKSGFLRSSDKSAPPCIESCQAFAAYVSSWSGI
jgi:hypothetical protein